LDRAGGTVILIGSEDIPNRTARDGSRLDKACETCHLEYWYPGDKKYVLQDEAKRVTIEPRK
jgi:formate-dependent nitrite reductase cytochrome c552 subunit